MSYISCRICGQPTPLGINTPSTCERCEDRANVGPGESDLDWVARLMNSDQDAAGPWREAEDE